MLRVTTRISHAKGIVQLSPWTTPLVTGFLRDAARFVTIPQYARHRHTEVEARLGRLLKYSEASMVNRVDYGSEELLALNPLPARRGWQQEEGLSATAGRQWEQSDFGIVTGGISYNHVREILPNASIFKIGMSNPMPIEAIRDFSRRFKKLLVVEELEPYYEDQIKAAGIKCEGKKFFPVEGELDPDVVADGLRSTGAINGSTPKFIPVEIDVMPRPPVLCAGCPHRPVFNALKKLKADVFGDIGCYTLGALQPLGALHACVCMGASIGMAEGVGLVQGSKRPVIAVIGDSTFLHSGMTPLLDAVYNKAPLTLIILDNRITAMTGGQEHPGSASPFKASRRSMSITTRFARR